MDSNFYTESQPSTIAAREKPTGNFDNYAGFSGPKQ